MISAIKSWRDVMNKTLLPLALLLIFYNCQAGESLVDPDLPSSMLSESHQVIKPTVFFLLRGIETPTEEEWKAIISKAYAGTKSESCDDLPEFSEFENIIIIDEGSNWAVAFVVFGNGGFVKLGTDRKLSNLTHVFLDNPNYIVYLDKETLETVEPPEDAISYLPLTGQTLLAE
jgi:hypothetical protein